MSTKHTLAQHTPGPWTYEGGQVIDANEGRYKDETYLHPYVIAEADRSYTNPIKPTTRDANMRLCAAAPDLLAACKEALAMCLGNAKGKDRYDLQNLMQEVIARAEGR